MKNVLAILIIITTFASCAKKDETCNHNDSAITVPASEIQNIQKYLADSNITATQHSSGFFYKITTQGSVQSIANLCSTVTVNYKGKLTNGTIFDQNTNFSPQLWEVITGWQKGLPLISKGGKITLYIPPSLGYGASGYGSIPGNSILIFDIELVNVS